MKTDNETEIKKDYDFPISCSDSCPHKLNCFYGKWGHCNGYHNEYNYNCMELHFKVLPQRFERKTLKEIK